MCTDAKAERFTFFQALLISKIHRRPEALVELDTEVSNPE